MIYGVIGIQILLCLVDRFPFKLSLLSVVSHVVYLGNMRRFPVVNVAEPLFIASCGMKCYVAAMISIGRLHTNTMTLVLVLVNHYFWFSHFSSASLQPYSRYDQRELPSFTEIASYFGICVWMVPFSLFVSLSASDNILPTMGSEQPGVSSSGSAERGKRQGMFKVLVDNVRDGITKAGQMAGWWRPKRDNML